MKADYLLMLLEDEAAQLAQTPWEMAQLLDAQRAFAEALRARGALHDDGRFRPSHEGKRVRREARALVVQGGPFDEERALGLYFWLHTSSAEEAAELAAACPKLPTDRVALRPIMKGEMHRQKVRKPGKIFGFAVLGRAPSEEAWKGVMDRIDEETRGTFPHESFLGGVRLHAPGAAPQSSLHNERRSVFDGPFLESKEVIGGLCFLRMATLADALRWASASRFVEHGTLEIRELWRS